MPADAAWAGETVDLDSDQVNSATALADATGLSLTVPAAGLYVFKFWVVFQTAATTTGIQLSVNGPAQSLLVFWAVAPTSLTAWSVSVRRIYDSGAATTGIDTANANTLAKIDGVVRATASGTLIVRFGSEVGGSNVTIKIGSGGWIRRMDNP